MTEGHITCADCEKCENCHIIQNFFAHKGSKYSKYKQSLEYIRSYGCDMFMETAEKWKNAYGKFQYPSRHSEK